MARLRTQGRDYPDGHMDNDPRLIKNKPVPLSSDGSPCHLHTRRHLHTRTRLHTYIHLHTRIYFKDIHTSAHAYTSLRAHTPHMHTLSYTHTLPHRCTHRLYTLGPHTRHATQTRTKARSRPCEPPHGCQGDPSPSNAAGATQQLMRTDQLRPRPPPPRSPCTTTCNTQNPVPRPICTPAHLPRQCHPPEWALHPFGQPPRRGDRGQVGGRAGWPVVTGPLPRAKGRWRENGPSRQSSGAPGGRRWELGPASPACQAFSPCHRGTPPPEVPPAWSQPSSQASADHSLPVQRFSWTRPVWRPRTGSWTGCGPPSPSSSPSSCSACATVPPSPSSRWARDPTLSPCCLRASLSLSPCHPHVVPKPSPYSPTLTPCCPHTVPVPSTSCPFTVPTPFIHRSCTLHFCPTPSPAVPCRPRGGEMACSPQATSMLLSHRPRPTPRPSSCHPLRPPLCSLRSPHCLLTEPILLKYHHLVNLLHCPTPSSAVPTPSLFFTVLTRPHTAPHCPFSNPSCPLTVSTLSLAALTQCPRCPQWTFLTVPG